MSINIDTERAIELYKTLSTEELSQEADRVCRELYGERVFLRGLIEFSNYCHCDCLYCGIRASNEDVHRFRMSEEDIINTAVLGYERKLRTFVLQSGEDSYYTTEMLCRIVETIKARSNNEAAITLSCGIKSSSEYAELQAAGADRYLIRFETSDPDLHKYLRGGISLKRRLKALEDLKMCGFETGSGFMVGLPGESEETRINNALLCKSLELDMVGIGPFIPHPATPLKDSERYDIDMTVRITALVRLLLPEANLPASTATGTVDPLGREKALAAGANVLMPNITPKELKQYYLLYPDKICLDESGYECIGCLNGRVGTIGKKLTLERGDSLSGARRKKLQFSELNREESFV